MSPLNLIRSLIVKKVIYYQFYAICFSFEVIEELIEYFIIVSENLSINFLFTLVMSPISLYFQFFRSINHGARSRNVMTFTCSGACHTIVLKFAKRT